MKEKLRKDGPPSAGCLLSSRGCVAPSHTSLPYSSRLSRRRLSSLGSFYPMPNQLRCSGEAVTRTWTGQDEGGGICRNHQTMEISTRGNSVPDSKEPEPSA
ncbi:hypothetical protein CLIM01_07553 [Colletotrichum limetticola]|uniref:Uncharacterized protein n=1 Tax=Colletotrichum limetticola TaxID=1209924 RepID=A0ABQ9PU82_9PEZI|nr:hypothetical protein CLIM01_07553 [Colletotrichum limetticola]